MTLIDIIELSAGGIAGISAILTIGVGVLQGHYTFDNAQEFYNDAPEDIKKIIGVPNKNKIYFQSILIAPKFMYNTLRNKDADTAFTKYVAPIEKERGTDFMSLYCMGQLMKRKKAEMLKK
jgi:hypothetical protein